MIDTNDTCTIDMRFPHDVVDINCCGKFYIQNMFPTSFPNIDALYRAKRLGFEWLATIDIDEYLVLNNGKSAGTTKPLKEYFHSLKESSVPHNSIQSIRLTSVPFGSGQKQVQELYIDHVYRRFIDIDDEDYLKQCIHRYL